MAVQTLPAHRCPSPHAAGTESPIPYSTTGNGLRFVGAQELLPAVPNAMPAVSFCSVILPPQPFLCGRARYGGLDTGNVSNHGSAAADAHQIDRPCSIQLLHACTVAICPSGLSCTPTCLETHLNTIQSTSLIPKYIFVCFA